MAKKKESLSERDLFVFVDQAMEEMINLGDDEVPDLEGQLETEGLAKHPPFRHDLPGKHRHTNAASGVPQFGGEGGAIPRDLRSRVSKNDPDTLPGPVIVKKPAQK